jgi:hypothetical protein
VRDHRREGKALLHEKLEDLRQRIVQQGLTFEQQLEIELHGTYDGYIQLLAKKIAAEKTGAPSYWDLAGGAPTVELVRIWEGLGGNQQNFHHFFESDHFRALPWPDIQGRLHASLYTQSKPIESGDVGDIDHLSLVLPIATFVVTDKRMEYRVRALGLDAKWGARVYSLSTTDALLADLGKIGLSPPA